MPFGVVSGVSRGMGVLDGVVIIEGDEVVLGGEFGRPIVTNEDFVVFWMHRPRTVMSR